MRSPAQRFSIGVGSLFTLIAVLWTGYTLVGASAGTISHTDHLNYTEPVRHLVVKTDSSDISVTGTSGTVVKVERRVSESLQKATPHARLRGDTLELYGGCPSMGGAQRCGVSYTIQLPRRVSVTAEADSGDVTVSDVDGAVDADADSGAVTVSDIGGPVRLHADSGSLAAHDLHGKAATLEADSGHIAADFAVVPTNVKAHADSGSVEIAVPPGSGAYAVTADTDSGRNVTEVQTDPHSSRRIDVSADSGSITVRYGR